MANKKTLFTNYQLHLITDKIYSELDKEIKEKNKQLIINTVLSGDVVANVARFKFIEEKIKAYEKENNDLREMLGLNKYRCYHGMPKEIILKEIKMNNAPQISVKRKEVEFEVLASNSGGDIPILVDKVINSMKEKLFSSNE